MGVYASHWGKKILREEVERVIAVLPGIVEKLRGLGP